jgi:hypothetical protein
MGASTSFRVRALQSRGGEGRTRLPNAVVAGRSRDALSGAFIRVGRPLRPNAPATPEPFRRPPNRAPALGTPGDGVAEGSCIAFVAASRFALRS